MFFVLINYQASAQILSQLSNRMFLDVKYRLLVICGSENEHRFSIASYLDKFKRQTLPVNTSQLRKYLGEKLAIQHGDVSKIRPAADVDWQR